MKSSMLQNWYQKEQAYDTRIEELKEQISLQRRGISPRKFVPTARMDESELIQEEIRNLSDSHETEMDQVRMRNLQIQTEIQNARAQLQLAQQKRQANVGFGS